MFEIAIITMMKNESDIIELFLKHNLDMVDHIFIRNHFSDDNSELIVKALIESGYPITLDNSTRYEFNQALEMNELLRIACKQGRFAFVMPLDADEFIEFGDRGAFRMKLKRLLAPDQCGVMTWRTFCPVRNDYTTAQNPLLENFRARNHEPIRYRKVVLGSELASECLIRPGNHGVYGRLADRQRVETDLIIQHFPVRSSDQIVQKAIIGSATLSLKQFRERNEGFHWDEIAKYAQTRNYSFEPEDLIDLSLRYGVPSSLSVPNLRLTDVRPKLSDRHSIEFRYLMNLDGKFALPIRERPREDE